jgi:hypothetical protein
MAKDLNVDTTGLRAAAAASASTAGVVLTSESVSGPTGTRPSDAGIAAVDAASAALRVRQAGRIAGQAGDLSAASAGYDDTDRSNAADISATV